MNRLSVVMYQIFAVIYRHCEGVVSVVYRLFGSRNVCLTTQSIFGSSSRYSIFIYNYISFSYF